MPSELQMMIDVVAKDKGIDPTIVITAIEDAYVAASRKVFKGEEDLRARFNLDTGQVELYAVRQIVESVEDDVREISLGDAQELYGDEAEVGMEIEFPKETDRLGRIAAQTAKQVIAQRVREAERENIHAEFSERVGEVVNATVKRFESGDIIAEIGRVEAQIPRREQSRAENYAIGDRVRAVIKDVSKIAKGPQVILSRTDPALLVKLFEQEVPEIYDGTVMIRGCVREAGDRAKVAVYSRERDVDPVGACVGMRGTRVQAIIRELRGEKIDIVEWSEDPVSFVTKALSPARVQRVTIVDDEQRVMEVMVEDRQLSLAIGKKGQNVRLAAKLCGWKIDIKSDEEKRKEVEATLEGIEFGGAVEVVRPLALPEIHDEVVAALRTAGFDTVEKVVEAGAETLGALPGFDAETVEAVLAAAEVERATIEAEMAELKAEKERLAAEQAAAQPELVESEQNDREGAAETSEPVDAADESGAERAEAESAESVKSAADADSTTDAASEAEADASADEPRTDTEGTSGA